MLWSRGGRVDLREKELRYSSSDVSTGGYNVYQGPEEGCKRLLWLATRLIRSCHGDL